MSTAAEHACRLCGGAGAPWREKAGYAIERCRDCGNATVPASAVPADLEAIYSAAYFEGGEETGYPTYLADRPWLERNFDRRLRWIEAARPPGRLLEVGPAYGVFLGVARERGWDAMGVEIAADCAEKARALSGAPVTAGDFLEADLPGGFDVVAMFDVIEHLRDPARALDRARELLAPGGVLVVETGDLAAPWARMLGRSWYFLDPPQHLAYFSAAGIERLARARGFTGPARRRRLGRWVSLANISFKLGLRSPIPALGRGLVAAARRGIPGAVYLNFGDTMVFSIARDQAA